MLISLLQHCLILYAVIYALYKLTNGKCRSSTCLVGKTAIVTGGNSGIGFAACLNLASRGCKVIIADKNNSEKSCSEIIRRSKNPNIFWKHLDLASFKSVRKFAQEINTELNILDILINNAGIVPVGKLSEDNLDLTMQVNYFGPFLLTHLLIDKIKNADRGRIVFTSSILAFFSCITIDDFGKLNEPITTQLSYPHSKLATIVASDIFAEKLRTSGILVNSVHPGCVNTTLFHHLVVPWYWTWYLYLHQLRVFLGVCRDPEVGCQNTLHVAHSEETAEITGKYFMECKPFFKPPQAYKKSFCKKIWEISEQRVGLTTEEKI